MYLCPHVGSENFETASIGRLGHVQRHIGVLEEINAGGAMKRKCARANSTPDVEQLPVKCEWHLERAQD